MPVVATDLEGKSVYLGAPVHITAENMVNTDFILQEPPKHAFYDNNPSSPTYGQVVTVSRYDTFNVGLKTSSGTTFSGKSHDHSNWNIGGSAEVSASQTVSFNAEIASGKDTTNESLKVSYSSKDRESHQRGMCGHVAPEYASSPSCSPRRCARASVAHANGLLPY